MSFNLETNIRKNLCLGLLLALGSVDAFAQLERVSPKKPESEASKPAADNSAQAKPAGSPNDPGPALKGISIVKSREEIQAGENVAVTGLKVGDGMQLDLLRDINLRAHLDLYIGKPINQYNLFKIREEIILFYRSKHHPLVDVIYPEQASVNQGVVQVIALEGKLGKVIVEGNKYFSTNLFTSAVTLRPGETIDSSALLSDVDWLNQNPGRNVAVAFQPGEKVGQSDVVLRVQDRFPLRAYVGYQNDGPRYTGEDRVFAGLNWFDAFGLDQRLNYQFTTDTEWKYVQAHSASYEIPLPWRHTLSFFGGYVDSKSDLNSTLAKQTGSSYQLSGRYSIPLPKIYNYQHAVDFGFDFKRMNNTLEFGGVPIFGGRVDVDQFMADYNGSLADPWGGTTVGAEAYYSPGGLSENNKAFNFNNYRFGASSSYFYSRFTLRRETKLPEDFSLVVRGGAQVANGALLPSEQYGMGGATTVRGYDEREANGDQGWLASVELWSPSFSLCGLLNKGVNDKLQLLAFMDCGGVENKSVLLGAPSSNTLASTGAGLRYSITRYLSVKFDYGWQLKDSHANNQARTGTSRGNIAAIVSY